MSSGSLNYPKKLCLVLYPIYERRYIELLVPGTPFFSEHPTLRKIWPSNFAYKGVDIAVVSDLGGMRE